MKAGTTADRFRYALDETTIADAQLFDGKLALLTNAPDLLARIHQHQARIAERTFEGTTTPTPEQLDLFDALNLPIPA